MILSNSEKFIFKNASLKNVYSPIFFRIKITEGKTIFSKFFNNLRHPINVYDEIDSQLQEIIKIKYPAEKKTSEQIQEAIKEHLQDCSKEEYGVWIYYPWSNNLIHTLDEKEFIELRTNRNLYKITREERDVLAQKKIGVIGMSVGQSVAITLAMERGCGELRLADFDDLELTNLNRIKSGIENLGVPKVVIAAREIARIDPFIKIKCYLDGIVEDNIDDFLLADGKIDLLVEECDSVNIKILSRQKARQHKIPVIMDTNDRGMMDVERYDLEPNRPMFHGLVKEITPSDLNQLPAAERLAYMLTMIDDKKMSKRLGDSIKEIGKTISSYPQLASSVVLGAALCTDVSRRILLNQFQNSGRYYIDVEQLIS
jgi:molybdopterin/thiamine biosynthesis adenylyltransferase